jgi:hypothetical protein
VIPRIKVIKLAVFNYNSREGSTMTNDEIEAIKRDIAFRNNEIRRIAEIDWESPQLRDVSYGLDGITLNIENLVKIVVIQSQRITNLDQRVTKLENQLGVK